MDYKKANELLKQGKTIDITNDNVITDRENGSQGDYNTIVKTYDIGDKDVFLQVILTTDSYGYGETFQSIQFVQAEEKTVKVFSPIKK